MDTSTEMFFGESVGSLGNPDDEFAAAFGTGQRLQYLRVILGYVAYISHLVFRRTTWIIARKTGFLLAVLANRFVNQALNTLVPYERIPTKCSDCPRLCSAICG
jgi:hypothetical protein